MHRVKFSSGILLYQDPVLAPKQGRVQRLDLSRGIRMTPSQVDMAALVPLGCPLVFQSLVSGPTACACTAPYNYDSHTFFLWKVRIIGFSEFGQAVKKRPINYTADFACLRSFVFLVCVSQPSGCVKAPLSPSAH